MILTLEEAERQAYIANDPIVPFIAKIIDLEEKLNRIERILENECVDRIAVKLIGQVVSP